MDRLVSKEFSTGLGAEAAKWRGVENFLHRETPGIRAFERDETENVDFVTSSVDRQNDRPYNPPIADAATPATAPRQRQATEIKKQFAISGFQVPVKTKLENRVLTDENVSTTTRHVDDAERDALPLSAFTERADELPGNRKQASVLKIRKLRFHRRLTLPG